MNKASITTLLVLISFASGCSYLSAVKLNEAEQLSAQLKEINTKVVVMQKTINELQFNKPAVSPNLFNLIDLRYVPEKFLIKKVVEASPKIVTADGHFGTGILLSKDGYILTDLHVVDLSATVNVTFYTVKESDYNYIYEAEVITGTVIAWTQKKKGDLAVVKINHPPPNVEPLALAPKLSLSDNQEVWRFGFNTGYLWTHGYYLTADNTDPVRLQKCVQLPVERGASGGPIVNGLGEVLGITQNLYESSNEVVTQNDTRLFSHHLSTDWFLPVDLIYDFLEQAKIKLTP